MNLIRGSYTDSREQIYNKHFKYSNKLNKPNSWHNATRKLIHILQIAKTINNMKNSFLIMPSTKIH